MIRAALLALLLSSLSAHASDPCEGRAIEYIDREGYEWCKVEAVDAATVELRFIVVETPEALLAECWRTVFTFSACAWAFGNNSVCRVYILAAYGSAMTIWHETQHCYGYQHRKLSPIHRSR